ncbi:MAG: adenylyltransferase/cytidyltransferase family protein [Candidatus Liptonbacteria bacterium]|nr:adenylyltransferase/cytidyltransferase family protein [Candidatus Liptonbacteria bacterium]
MPKTRSKIKGLAALLTLVRAAKRAGKTIVTTNGCFDVLHVGHTRNLSYAKSLGDVLIVGVNSDASVRALKGRRRPILPARERAELLASLAAVDYVLIFGGGTPNAWLNKIKPHVHVKGAEQRAGKMAEAAVMRRHGGKIVLAPYHKGRSTTAVIEKIIRTHRGR